MIPLNNWTRSQIDEVVNLLNEASPFDAFEREHVREVIFDDPDYAPDLLVCVRSGGELIAAVAAVVRPDRGSNGPKAPMGFVKLFAVAPAWRRRGIGAQLLAVVEQQLGQAGVETIRVFGSAPSFLRPGVDFRLTPFVCFLLKHGYRSQRNAVNMEVELEKVDLDTTSDEERLRRLGFTVRRLEPADAEAFETYMQGWWSWNWKTEACRSLRRNPVSTHIAIRADAIVGFASHGVSGPGQFGPMGTNEELRGQGVGAVLLKRCLTDLREQGRTVAEIQWVGPIGFYATQVGATLTRCFWQFEKLLVQHA